MIPKLKNWCAEEPGRASVLAAKLGVQPSFITQVANGPEKPGRPVPTIHGAAIEVATEYAVRRWDLRPNDWYRHWPELIGAEGAPAVESVTA